MQDENLEKKFNNVYNKSIEVFYKCYIIFGEFGKKLFWLSE